MKRVHYLWVLLICFLLVGCKAKESTIHSTNNDEAMIQESEENEGMIKVSCGNASYQLTLEDNDTVKALLELLDNGPITMDAENNGGFEKVCDLGADLPTSDERMSSKIGDVYLYNGNQIVIFFGENTWEYTRIGHFENIDPKAFKEAFSGPEMAVTMEK